MANLFSSKPIRNAPSAKAASKLPFPASDPVTAYSLTKACSNISLYGLETLL